MKPIHMGITYLHLAGVRGFALPGFAGPYSGAIPRSALSMGNAEIAEKDLTVKQL